MSARQSGSYRLSLAGGGAIEAYLSHAGAAGPDAVVYVHGFGSTRNSEKPRAVEEACARREWTFVSFDFRGHGASTGTMLELRGSRLLEDLEALQQDLARKGMRRLFPVGSSMGGWAATWFTLRHPEMVPACAVIAPAFDFVRGRYARLSDAERARWKETGRLLVKNDWVDTEIGYGLVEEIDRFPVENLAAGWPRPLLIFHGMRDDIVPYTQSVAFAEKAACPGVELHLFKNGDHRLVEWKDEMAEAACDFFGRFKSR
jgi:pimeloyl-ACP methyl ester carboxylesterase